MADTQRTHKFVVQVPEKTNVLKCGKTHFYQVAYRRPRAGEVYSINGVFKIANNDALEDHPKVAILCPLYEDHTENRFPTVEQMQKGNDQ